METCLLIDACRRSMALITLLMPLYPYARQRKDSTCTNFSSTITNMFELAELLELK